jgi:hypothetical protein
MTTFYPSYIIVYTTEMPQLKIQVRTLPTVPIYRTHTAAILSTQSPQFIINYIINSSKCKSAYLSAEYIYCLVSNQRSSVTVLSHQWSTVIFIYMLLLSEGQMDEAWEPSKSKSSFRNPSAVPRRILSLF